MLLLLLLLLSGVIVALATAAGIIRMFVLFICRICARAHCNLLSVHVFLCMVQLSVFVLFCSRSVINISIRPSHIYVHVWHIWNNHS